MGLATAESVALEREQSDLLQLLYLCPVAIVRLTAGGKIVLMNPYGAQLLMPLSADGSLRNLFDLLEPHAPEVAEMVRRFEDRAGKVCEEHRIELPPGRPSLPSIIISITLQKIDADIFVAVLTDVTSAARRELHVRRSEERLHAVLDGLNPCSICTLDTKGVVTSWNRGAEWLDDYRSDEAIGRHIDMIESRTGGTKSPMTKRLELAARGGSHQFESWRVRKDGRQYWASTSIGVLYDKDGSSPLGYSMIAHDMTEQRRAEDRLRLLATTDPLTGALNRRAFFDNAKREREHAAQSGEWVAVLLLDADRFKAVNDVHGHEAGDGVLQRIVDDCRKEIRAHDVLGRFGGEEFAIFLAGCDMDAGRDAAERICRRVAEPRGAEFVPCTVSIGVAASRTADDTIEELIRRADSAMYAGKNNGRNRVEVA